MPSLLQTSLTERDQLEQLALDLADMYRRAESHLQQVFARQVAAGLEQNPDQVLRSIEIGRLREAASTVASQLQRLAPEQVARIMATAAEQGALAALSDLAQLTGTVNLAGQPNLGGASTATPEAVVQEGVRRTLSSNPAAVAVTASLQSRLEDVTKRILRWPDDVYRRATLQATQDLLLTGRDTSRTIQRRAWQQLTAQGVTGFTDSAGRNWNLGSYVEMATRTATRRAWDEQHTSTMQQVGLSLVSIVVGSGACRECSAVSGKIYRTDAGPTGTVWTEDVTTGKKVRVKIAGTIDDARAHGWRHPNCRCRTVPYLPGLSVISDQTVYDPQAEADRARLRELERGVRQAKAQGDNVKVRQLQAQIREHVAATGIARQPNREQLDLGNRQRLPAPAA